MRSAPALTDSSNTMREPSTLRAWVASPAERMANARWTTTSEPFTASRTLSRSRTSPCRYSVFFQPASAGSNGRRAIPTIFFTPRERSSADTSAMPRSPVGPVTVTVRPSVAIARLARQHDLGGLLAVVDPDARHHGLDLAAAGRLEGVLHRLELGELLQVLDRWEDELELAAAVGVERVRRAQPAQVDALLSVAARIGVLRCLGNEEVG